MRQKSNKDERRDTFRNNNTRREWRGFKEKSKPLRNSFEKDVEDEIRSTSEVARIEAINTSHRIAWLKREQIQSRIKEKYASAILQAEKLPQCARQLNLTFEPKGKDNVENPKDSHITIEQLNVREQDVTAVANVVIMALGEFLGASNINNKRREICLHADKQLENKSGLNASDGHAACIEISKQRIEADNQSNGFRYVDLMVNNKLCGSRWQTTGGQIPVSSSTARYFGTFCVGTLHDSIVVLVSCPLVAEIREYIENESNLPRLRLEHSQRDHYAMHETLFKGANANARQYATNNLADKVRKKQGRRGGKITLTAKGCGHANCMHCCGNSALVRVHCMTV